MEKSAFPGVVSDPLAANYFSIIDCDSCFNKVSSDTDFGVVENGVNGQEYTFKEISRI